AGQLRERREHRRVPQSGRRDARPGARLSAASSGSPGLLADADWVAVHRLDDCVVVVDARWFPDGSGRAKYEVGHIPGAVFVDVDVDLSAPKTAATGRHPLPTPEAFAAAMSRLGIGDDDLVVAYDDAGDANASRLWWMLEVTGHRAALLDGGVAAWP